MSGKKWTEEQRIAARSRQTGRVYPKSPESIAKAARLAERRAAPKEPRGKRGKFNLAYAEKAMELYRHYGIHPIDWVVDKFGENYKMTLQHRDYWEKLGRLIEVKLKLANGEKLTEEEKADYGGKIGISIMAGQGVGKDCVGALTNLFFLDCFPYPKVLNTSPSWNALQDTLWAEIGKWRRKSNKLNPDDPNSLTEFEHKFDYKSEKIYYKHLRDKNKEWFSAARTVATNSSPEEQAETLSGRHEDYMLFVIDEASGVPDAVFKPLEGSLTGIVNIALLLFNPTRTSGFALNTHSGDSKRWITLRWNAEESELVNQEHCRILADKYGKDSNPYRIRVLGLPPIADTNTLIPYDWIHDAIDRPLLIPDNTPVIKGLDCGAGGDKSVICTRKGGKIYPLKRNNTKDSRELMDWVKYDFLQDEASILFGDVIGVGWAVVGGLKSELRGGKIRGVDSRGKADNDERFYNKRAEAYWNVREAFEEKTISIPNDPDLIDQLSILKTKTDNKGRLMIGGKEDIKKAIGHSPDESDALALCYAKKTEFLCQKEVEDEEEKMERIREEKMEKRRPSSYPWMGA